MQPRSIVRDASPSDRNRCIAAAQVTKVNDCTGSFAHCRIFESGPSNAMLLTSLGELLQRPLAPTSVRLDDFSEWRLTKYCGQSDRKSPTASLGRLLPFGASHERPFDCATAFGLENASLFLIGWILVPRTVREDLRDHHDEARFHMGAVIPRTPPLRAPPGARGRCARAAYTPRSRSSPVW